MSQELIARLVGVGHSTVSRWLRALTFPERKQREQASQLDPYRRYGKTTAVGGVPQSHGHLSRTAIPWLPWLVCHPTCSICQILIENSNAAGSQFTAHPCAPFGTASDMVICAPS